MLVSGVTSMICFTSEKKIVQGNCHRMASRGNATSFPLPWQGLQQQLHEGDAVEELGKVRRYNGQAKNSLS